MSGYEWFAPVYDAWAADMTEDVDYYVGLAQEAEGPIIELAAGSGRVSIPIAQRTGKRVIGIDLSQGCFAWNAFVFDHRYVAAADGHWDDERLRHLIEFAPGDNRVDITLEDVPALSLWWVARSEWEGFLDVAGLETEALHGWFDRRPFDDSSREFVWACNPTA